MAKSIFLAVLKSVLALVMTVVVFTVFRGADNHYKLTNNPSQGELTVQRPADDDRTQEEMKENLLEQEEQEIVPEPVEIIMDDIPVDMEFETGDVFVPVAEPQVDVSAVDMPSAPRDQQAKSSASGAEGLYELKNVDMKPTVEYAVKPEYPMYALRSRIEGKVYVKLKISTAGAVIDAEVMKADPEGVFDKAALKAVRKWRFTPAYKENRKVNVWGVIVPISFSLEQ
ncbi:TonB family protein [Denitrovibrio acetiphilus DSM 12809]|uniref:TonB family protein n=1 Tax=Denitrovibrio acetiphilus (strain DSM 12809 / NBRC 114555 / N2460) TaxID=522772 RepID=D4H6N1_DENA2|nr:energy transducer TonB [Denitrovibrio acetiphilus]ADD67747.1 TonB family protein [Denitrovibrio acetiphilus DSM 12809]